MSHPEEEPLKDLDEEDDGDHCNADAPQEARVRDRGRNDAGGASRGGLDMVRAVIRRVRSIHTATVADGPSRIGHARRRPWGTLLAMLNVRLLLRSRGEA